ncbi:MAG: TMEM175 family protein [Desulfobacterota bacterium]|nr:TMEM175 family protein [Thermodesulfobacteriota bacterium]
MIAREFSVNRLEAFSDGVLAIVVTLLLLCFVPFPTAFIGDFPRNPIALALFALVLMLSGIAFNLMWRYALARGLTEENAVQSRISAAIRRGLLGPLAYALSGGAALVFLPLSWLILLWVPVF